jgi:hypothetical protein
MMNNLSESLAAYSLTFQGRDEIRKREKGESSREPEIPSQGAFPVCPNAAILKAHCREEIPDDEVISAVFQFAANSESMIGEDECAPSAFASDRAPSESYTPREDEDQEVPRFQTFREHLASFAIISEEQRLSSVRAWRRTDLRPRRQSRHESEQNWGNLQCVAVSSNSGPAVPSESSVASFRRPPVARRPSISRIG